MSLPKLYSISPIEKIIPTAEQPVVILCSDINTYYCKYMRANYSSYKLACELIGGIMAKAWGLETPSIALISIKSKHWNGLKSCKNKLTPCIGSKRMEGVIEITPATLNQIKSNYNLIQQLMEIALFDFWIANEDRNSSNANLMYSADDNKLISIDYGFILNNASFDIPLSQLTTTDTILKSDLFHNLVKSRNRTNILGIGNKLINDLNQKLRNCELQKNFILEKCQKLGMCRKKKLKES